MMGPLLIFDKSFLQMLAPAEVAECGLHFQFVSTPVLVREIIADLDKPPSTPGRLPADVVKALARKMRDESGLQCPDWRILTTANLCGCNISMIGQVPVDPTAPNVRSSNGGRWLLYDGVPDQAMWARWAEGDFSPGDTTDASLWRQSLAGLNLDAIRESWRPFSARHFAGTSDMPTLIAGVEDLVHCSKPDVQLELLKVLLDFVSAPDEAKALAFKPLLDRTYGRIRDYAPYAASVLKLQLCYCCGLARGFIGPRASDAIDLQYLLYAPFCMAFASADKLHRALWPAAAGVNDFVWGTDLKQDLAARLTFRSRMSEDQLTAHGEVHGFYPPEIEGSIVSDLWRRYMRPEGIPEGRDRDREPGR